MFSTPAVAGEVVCVGSCSGTFFALDRATGEVRGRHDVIGADSVRRQFHGDPRLDDGLLLIGTDAGEGDTSYVYAFERGTANVRWRQPMGPGMMGDIAAWKDRRYAVTMLDELVCFDAQSGVSRWSYRPEPSGLNERSGTPLVVGERVYYSDRHGTVRAFEAGTGRLLWERSQIEPLKSWLVHVGSSLLFMRGAETLVRLDPGTGRERRRTLVPGGPYIGPIAVAGESLLVLLGPFALTAYDLRLDRVRWSQPAAREWTSARPRIWRDIVLAGDRERLFAYGLADGLVRWTHGLGGAIRGIGAHGDTLYVGTLKGTVHALLRRREGER